MDPSTHAAAVEIALAWFREAPIWNFGRFNDAINPQFYPQVLKVQFPLPVDWDVPRKMQMRTYAKTRKRDLYNHVLEQLAVGDDLELARKALCALPKDHLTKNIPQNTNSLRVNLIQLAPQNITIGSDIQSIATGIPRNLSAGLSTGIPQTNSRPPPPYSSDSPPSKRFKAVSDHEPEVEPLHEDPQVSQPRTTLLTESNIQTFEEYPVSDSIPQGTEKEREVSEPRDTEQFQPISASDSTCDSNRDIDDDSEVNSSQDPESTQSTAGKAPGIPLLQHSRQSPPLQMSRINQNNFPLQFPQKISSTCTGTMCCRHLFSEIDCEGCCSHPATQQVIREPPETLTQIPIPLSTRTDHPSENSLPSRNEHCNPQPPNRLERQVEALEERLQAQEERLKLQEEFSKAIMKVARYQRKIDKTWSVIADGYAVSKKRHRE